MITGDNCKGEIILWQSLGLKYTTQLSTWLWRDTGCVVNSLVSGHPFGIRKKCLFVALCAYKNYSFRQTQKDKKRLDVCLWECYVNLVNVKRTVCFLVDKWRFDKTDPHWSVSLSKALILVLTLNMSFPLPLSLLFLLLLYKQAKFETQHESFFAPVLSVQVISCQALWTPPTWKYTWQVPVGWLIYGSSESKKGKHQRINQ